MHSLPSNAPRPRRSRRRGAELIEFTLLFIPMLAMTGVILNVAWAVYAKATISRAVRIGARTGVTLTASQMSTSPKGCLTDTIKAVVKDNAMGLLSSSGSLIHVNYYQPPAASATTSATLVNSSADANQAGNILKVSVDGFSLSPLFPLFFDTKKVDKSPLVFSVSSADVIEPNSNPACVGVAP